MSNILSIDKDKLDRACVEMKLSTFDVDEYSFLKEYRIALTPITVALKILKANKYTFGLYLLTLIGLRRKLAELKRLDSKKVQIYKFDIDFQLNHFFQRKSNKFLICQFFRLYIHSFQHFRMDLNTD